MLSVPDARTLYNTSSVSHFGPTPAEVAVGGISHYPTVCH